MTTEQVGNDDPSYDDTLRTIGDIIRTLQTHEGVIGGTGDQVELVAPVSSKLSRYREEIRRTLADDYKDVSGIYSQDCGSIAEEIAEILAGDGESPELLHLRGRSIDAVNTEELVPLVFEGRVRWGGHIVCRSGGMVHDPMLAGPVPEASYPKVAFGVDELQVRRVVPFIPSEPSQ